MGAFEQFVVFGTDSIGLERILRLSQAVFHILSSYPLLLSLLPSSPLTAQSTLLQLRGRLNVTRRWIRLFRFLDAFHAGWTLYVAVGHKGLDTWLDIVAKTTLGLYGLLETVTVLDVSDVRVWGPERTRSLNYESQALWFVALYASALSSAVKLFYLFAYRPVPQAGSGYGTGEEPIKKAYSEKDESKTPAVEADEQLSREDQLNKERERLRVIIKKRKQERRQWIREVSTKAKGLGKGIITNLLDMLLPAASCGWVNVHPGLVGIAMFCTSIISGLTVWERCGKQIQRNT